METRIVKITNMCGTYMGEARVTINRLKNAVVEPLADKHAFRSAGVLYNCDTNGEYVHYGLASISKSQHA